MKMAMAMAKLAFPLLCVIFSLFFIPSLADLPQQTTTTTSTFVTPIQKDRSTLQYSITAYLQTPLKPAKLLLHLGGSFTWVNCDTNFVSTTYKHIPCHSPLAYLLGQPACLERCVDPPGPNCANNSCLLIPDNPIKPIDFAKSDPIAAALTDYLAFPTLVVNGSTQVGPLEKIRNFIFSCGHTSYLKGLAKGVVGVAGLGRSNISIPVQITPHIFAICLSGSKSQPGVAFLGSKGPYNLPKIDLAKSLTYTPLIVNPIGKDYEVNNKVPSAEFYIKVSSIKINNKVVALNQTLLTINGENGFGGTKISTVVPYTNLQTSIYKAVTTAFLKAAASPAYNLTKTTAKPVKPFSVCYPARDVKVTEMGPTVPTIDLVLDKEDVVWKIFGSNSMVRVTKKGGVDVWCLGFVDGGVSPTIPSSNWIGGPSIVIGGLQLEDNMLQFDLESKKLGFSSSILSKGTNCANFKFSSKKV